MENSLNLIFGEIWPKTLYYSTGTLTQFLSNLYTYWENYRLTQEQYEKDYQEVISD